MWQACRDRASLEAWAGGTLAFMGVWINLPPVDAFDRLQVFMGLRMWAPGEVWGTLMLVVGMAVVVTCPCPTRERIAAHAAATFLWLFFALTFLFSFPTGIALPMFGAMAVAEAVLTAQAVIDYRVPPARR